MHMDSKGLHHHTSLSPNLTKNQADSTQPMFSVANEKIYSYVLLLQALVCH